MKKNKPAYIFIAAVLILTFGFLGYKFIFRENRAPEAPGNVRSSTAEAFTGPEENLEISIALWSLQDSLGKPEKDQFYKHLCDKFHISIKPVPITWDDYMEKIQILAASNQLPDIFSADAFGSQQYRNWVDRGLLKALPQDLSKYPTLSDYLAKHEIEYLKSEGKLYCIPRGLYDSILYCAHDRNVFYRWDLAQKAGIKTEPETWEEFESMLEAVISADAENKNIAGLTAVNIKHIGGFLWLYSNPAATSDGSGNDFKWIKEDGRYIPAVFSKNAEVSLENARSMYERGLIDKDITMIKGSQAYEKFASGKAAAIIVVGYGNLDTMINSIWRNRYPHKKLTDAVKRVKYFPAADGIRYQSVFKTYWSESYFNAGIDDDKLDRILRLYDYMLTPEAKEFYRFGVENKDFRKEGNKIVPITEPEKLVEKQRSAPVLGSLVEFDNKFQYDDNNYTMDPDIRKAAVEDLKTVMNSTRIPEYEPRLTYLSTPAKDRFSIFDYDDILEVMLGREPVREMWRKIVTGYEAKGLSKMIEEVNAKAKELGID